MKCANCGAELNPGTLYCPKCGCEVQVVSEQSVLEDELLDFLRDDEDLKRLGAANQKKTAGGVPGQAGTAYVDKAEASAKTAASGRIGSAEKAGNMDQTVRLSSKEAGAQATIPYAGAGMVSGACPGGSAGSRKAVSAGKISASGKKDSSRKIKKEAVRKKHPAQAQGTAQSTGKKKRIRISRQMRLLTGTILLAACAVILIAALAVRAGAVSRFYEKAEIAYNTGDYDSAKVWLLKVLEREEDSEESVLLLAQVYAKQGESENAEAQFLLALELNPESEEACEGLLELYRDEGDYDSIVAMEETVTSQALRELVEDYIVEVPEASVEGGTYYEEFEVRLTAQTGCKIYYTLDGSDPEEKGLLYDDEIVISETGETTLRAVSMSEDGFYSEVLEETYTIW